ncbi:MAG: O-antigen ligase family protein [Endomicrobium sp.]|jgi:putative inorganic carbon (HCO3(-)) transporter|nr:O-antigen ligase family protein [Endomicrobium sp.]
MKSYSQIFQKSLKQIILFGLPVLYFLIAVSFYLKTYDSAQIKITILHIGGLFLFMSWLILKTEEGDFSFFKNKFVYILPILLFLLSGFLSLSISPFKLASFTEFIKRFIYCGMAFIIISEFDSEKKLLRIKNWLIIAAYVVCVYGTIQIIDYYFFPPLPNKGLDPFAWRQAFGNRIMSTFGNPNFYGDFLIVMNPIVLALFLYKRRFYLLFLWVLIFINTVSTYSKGAWLGFAVGILFFAVIYAFVFLKDRINKKTLSAVLITGTLIAAVAFFGIFSYSKKRPDSLSFRVFTWLSCWEMINTNPVFGTGIGSFYLTYPAWRRPQIFFIEGKHNTESDHPENEYLEVWFDEGIIGLTIFLLLIVLIFTLGYKNMVFLRGAKGTRDGPLAYIQLGVLAAFAAKLSHDSVCVSLRFVSSGVVLWLLIGLTISISVQLFCAKDVQADRLNRAVKTVIQIAIVAVFGWLIYFFAGFFHADLLHSGAIQYSRIGNWDAALATYGEVNKYNPSYPMSKYFKANVHVDRWKAGDPVTAERTFKELWKLAPNYVQSKYLAGTMYSKMWEANKKLKEEYEAGGKSPEVIEKQEKETADSYNNALKYFNEYKQIDPIYPLTYYGIASLYANVGNFDKAEEVLYEHIKYVDNLKKHPHDFWVEDWESRRAADYAETYSQLGNLNMYQGKLEPAKNMYLKALELSPEYIIVKKNLAVVYANLGDNENSNKQWVEVYKINPDDEDAKRYLQAIGAIPK